MKPTKAQIWAPHFFAVTLAAITVIGNLAGGAITGNSTFVILPFICMFPLVSMFAVFAQKQTLDYVDSLETRVRQLEGKTLAA